jgi:hypothetical protein
VTLTAVNNPIPVQSGASLDTRQLNSLEKMERKSTKSLDISLSKLSWKRWTKFVQQQVYRDLFGRLRRRRLEAYAFWVIDGPKYRLIMLTRV